MSIPTSAPSRISVRTITIQAICIALVFVATRLINIRLPLIGNGGLIHLGNVPLFLSAFIFGKRTGAIAGGVGMALFDLISGWVLWAPFTLVIVGMMGYVSGLVAEKNPLPQTKINYLIAVALAILIKIIGYYVAEGLIYGNWLAPIGSIPGNIIQVGFSGLLVIPVTDRLIRLIRKQVV